MDSQTTVLTRLSRSATRAGLIIGLSLAADDVSAQTRIDRALALAYFTEATTVAAQTDTLWRTRTLGALLFVDPVTREVVANVADSTGTLTSSDGVFTGTLPADLPIANTAVSVGGQRYAMMMWPLPTDRDARLRLLFHESFHRVQEMLALPGRDASNAHLNTTSGRIWMRLEWRALAEALLRTGSARARALRDAMAFRAMRLTLAASARADEQALLMHEGLAEYSGWLTSVGAVDARHRRVALAMLSRERQESFVRTFAYASGPAYGVLLDDAQRPWRRALTSSSDIPAMLSSAYRLGRVDTTGVLQRSERYGGVLVRADESERADQRAATERTMRARFVDAPVVLMPVADSFAYSFDPNDAFPLAGVGIVYGASQISAVWGTLRVAREGVLFGHDRDGNIVGIVVPAPIGDVAPAAGAGWTLTLAPGWVVRPGRRTGDWVVERR